MLERNSGIDVKEKQAFYYQGIFKKYNVSSGRFDQNLAYYRQDPENFVKMYERVVRIIEDRRVNAAFKK